MKPRVSILSKDFVYRSAAKTDVAATIRREKKRLAAEKEAKVDNVRVIRKAGK